MRLKIFIDAHKYPNGSIGLHFNLSHRTGIDTRIPDIVSNLKPADVIEHGGQLKSSAKHFLFISNQIGSHKEQYTAGYDKNSQLYKGYIYFSHGVIF
jgi:hypothetical protein